VRKSVNTKLRMINCINNINIIRREVQVRRHKAAHEIK